MACNLPLNFTGMVRPFSYKRLSIGFRKIFVLKTDNYLNEKNW